MEYLLITIEVYFVSKNEAWWFVLSKKGERKREREGKRNKEAKLIKFFSNQSFCKFGKKLRNESDKVRGRMVMAMI